MSSSCWSSGPSEWAWRRRVCPRRSARALVTLPCARSSEVVAVTDLRQQACHGAIGLGRGCARKASRNLRLMMARWGTQRRGDGVYPGPAAQLAVKFDLSARLLPPEPGDDPASAVLLSRPKAFSVTPRRSQLAASTDPGRPRLLRSRQRTINVMIQFHEAVPMTTGEARLPCQG